jgi:hypothetical protein
VLLGTSDLHCHLQKIVLDFQKQNIPGLCLGKEREYGGWNQPYENMEAGTI